jgi:hypothetical protein
MSKKDLEEMQVLRETFQENLSEVEEDFIIFDDSEYINIEENF